ncbi:hypothetical protein [Bradyrhizobium ganzhouense]|uniref:hypothetical protein n=1 Tax=Bradyrhizobium ganzhouense TaxID=1179767 RepID=UPI003CF1682C
MKTAEKLLFERSLRARDIEKRRKQLRENIFRRCVMIIGFCARGDGQVRSRVRQTKMMKIATTTAPASIQY